MERGGAQEDVDQSDGLEGRRCQGEIAHGETSQAFLEDGIVAVAVLTLLDNVLQV